MQNSTSICIGFGKWSWCAHFAVLWGIPSTICTLSFSIVWTWKLKVKPATAMQTSSLCYCWYRLKCLRSQTEAMQESFPASAKRRLWPGMLLWVSCLPSAPCHYRYTPCLLQYSCMHIPDPFKDGCCVEEENG